MKTDIILLIHSSVLCMLGVTVLLQAMILKSLRKKIEGVASATLGVVSATLALNKLGQEFASASAPMPEGKKAGVLQTDLRIPEPPGLDAGAMKGNHAP
ncbi:MAG TPA: hypothetical protein VNO50_10820 [Pyrinomonadaceae bacterium]|nr:hypothetical protein [Pyrinomonadaceae bacterium]